MIGANGARGEAVVTLDGAPRRLCLTLGALAEIETGLGVAGMAALAERMKALSARDWDRLKEFVSDDCIYLDMPVGPAAAARGR